MAKRVDTIVLEENEYVDVITHLGASVDPNAPEHTIRIWFDGTIESGIKSHGNLNLVDNKGV